MIKTSMAALLPPDIRGVKCKKDCIRLWEKGVRMEDVADKEKSAYIVFAPDSLQVELFFSGDQPNEILDRRSLPGGDYAWNVEDDDTKNVRQENGKMDNQPTRKPDLSAGGRG